MKHEVIMKRIKNKKIRTTILVICALLFAAAAGGGYYALRAKGIIGVTLTPSQDYEVHPVAYYLQNDPLWSDDKIGTTSRNLGGAGCLISCVASAITDLVSTMTPGELNKLLTDVGGYSGADLIWYKISEAVPSVTYTYSRIFTARTIENDLKQGLLPIMNVKYRGGLVSHWVLIVGAEDGDFLVYDPLSSDQEPIPLSVHGKVYAYRVLHPYS
jgi:hypothetical protein